ncbi:MAG: hypothetical protein U1E65_12080 [Myxococcota bacterium]
MRKHLPIAISLTAFGCAPALVPTPAELDAARQAPSGEISDDAQLVDAEVVRFLGRNGLDLTDVAGFALGEPPANHLGSQALSEEGTLCNGDALVAIQKAVRDDRDTIDVDLTDCTRGVLQGAIHLRFSRFESRAELLGICTKDGTRCVEGAVETHLSQSNTRIESWNAWNLEVRGVVAGVDRGGIRGGVHATEELGPNGEHLRTREEIIYYQAQGQGRDLTFRQGPEKVEIVGREGVLPCAISEDGSAICEGRRGWTLEALAHAMR